MKIQTNVMSLNSQRALAGNAADLSRSLERLSSGLRINSAKDDAAGLAITSRLGAQLRGMNVARRNASDGISMLQTAEGALASAAQQVQRIRDLAVQATNATNSATDRAALAAEAQQLMAEIDRIGTTADFNGQLIFAQNASSIGGDPTRRAVVDGLRLGWLEEAENLILQNYGIQADGADMQIDITADTDGAGGVAAFVAAAVGGQPGGRGTNLRLSIDMADFTPPNLPSGGSAPMYNDRIIAHEMVHAVMARATNWQSLTSTSMWFTEGAAEFIHGADERVQADIAAAAGGSADAKIATVVNEIATWQLQSADYSAGYIGVRYLHDKLMAAGFSGGIKDFMVYLNGASAPTMDQAMTHFFGGGYTQASFLAEIQADSGNGLSNGVMFVKNKMNLANTDTGAIGGADVGGGPVRTAAEVLTNRDSGYSTNPLRSFRTTWQNLGTGVTATRTASLQVGANAGQTNDVQLGALGVTALGLGDVDLEGNAKISIVHLDEALTYLNSQRAMVGAQMSRLENTISNLATSVEAGSASQSRVLDTDYATETATLTRARILQQAGTAILAQANTQQSRVLQLLR